MIDQWWFLLLLGLFVGTLGTLIGAGGGFVLVPILLFLLPKVSPEQITAISLAVVFFNALSGSVAYLRMGRIDLVSAAWFALATLPGAVLGAVATKSIPRHEFNVGFGVLLVAASAYLVFKPEVAAEERKEPLPAHTRRTITDAAGNEHEFHYSMPLALSLSVLIGFISSLIGIGGGIIHVPVLNRALNFPVHLATATSQAILCVMALAGSLVHWTSGNLEGRLDTVGGLAIGAVVGAQLGALLSTRFKGSWIIRALAIALGVVGARILLAA